jgi:hypothetical protein
MPSAEQWNGTSWTVQSVPSPSGGGTLSSLACPAANTCLAAGGTGTQATLAEGWNGTSWTIQTTPDPTGAAASIFGGISCAATTTCVAVGYSTAANGKQSPLAETYSG